jgi:hypothetical protein
MTINDIMHEIRTMPTVPLWPHVGRVLHLSKNGSYAAARRGEIPTVRFGRAIRVATAPLRRMLGIDDSGAV